MATQVQFRRGTTAQNSSFTGAAGELTINTDTDSLIIHDGSTQGGIAVAKADLSNTASVGVLTATIFNGDVNSSGVSTFANGNVVVGGATTTLLVEGDARITGILTVGGSSLTLDGTNNVVNVGTALTLGHTQGLQFHTQNLHSAGFEVNNINASGIVTASNFVGDGSLLTNLPGGGGGLTNFTESQSTYSSIVSSIFDASGTDTNINAVLSPKGTGAIIGQEPDGTTAGGNARGAQSVDLQNFSRSAATQVASGARSIIPGGYYNTASGTASVAMGKQNTSSAGFAHAYGNSNTSSGYSSFTFGSFNYATGQYDTSIGYQATSSGNYSVATGYNATADALYSMASGVKANTHGIKGLHAIAPFANTTSTYKYPQFYKVILTAITPVGESDSNRRYLTTDGGSVASNNSRTDSRYNSIYIGRTDGTNDRQIYVEGIIKASDVNNASNYAVYEMYGFLRGADTGNMQNAYITKKFGSNFQTPDIDHDFGYSGSGDSREWWWNIKVNGNNSASLLWVAYLTCYVTDAP